MARREEERRPKTIEEKVREMRERGSLNYEAPRINRYDSKSKAIMAGTPLP